MERLTTEKNMKDMQVREIFYNSLYVKNGEVWFRDNNRELPFRNLIRNIAKEHMFSLPEKDDDLEKILFDWQQFLPEKSERGLLALINMLGIALAETREHLKTFEDADDNVREMYEDQFGIIDLAKEYIERVTEINGGKKPKHVICLSDEDTLQYEAYKKAKEQGLIRQFPVKVGDSVFEVQKLRNHVQEYIVTGIRVYEAETFYEWKLAGDGIYTNVTGFAEFALGKMIFVKREDAEAKLSKVRLEND